MASSQEAQTLLSVMHHERQEPGSMLCAQHALNALLQGPYFDPSQLAEIAAQMDELERAHLDSQAWSSRGRDEGSLNVDATGFFSATVLENALSVWGLQLVRWRSQAMSAFQSQPEKQLAFILNLEQHWFCLRRFGPGWWFNLNSCIDAPAWVGPSYLGALLDQAESEGYSVFAIVAAEDAVGVPLSTSPADEVAQTLPSADVVLASNASSPSAITKQAQGLRPNSEGGPSVSSASRDTFEEDAELQAALRASMLDASEGDGPASVSVDTASTSQSPAAPRGTRRNRSINSASEEEGGVSQDETDEHVDEIAPSRRRFRADDTLRSSSSTLLAPTDSAARPSTSNRRPSRADQKDKAARQGETSRAAIDHDEQELMRAMEASLGAMTGNQQTVAQNFTSSSTGTSASASRPTRAIDIGGAGVRGNGGRRRRARGGGGREDPIAIGSDGEEDEEEVIISRSNPRSPFLDPLLAAASRDDEDVADLDDDEDEGDDDAGPLSNPERRQLGVGEEEDDEDAFHSLSEGSEGFEEVSASAWARARPAGPSTNRTYDDEDADLQRALAASMRDVEGGGDDVDWSAFEWQDDGGVSTRRQERPSTPEDVGRIRRLREEAKKKAEEEKEDEERRQRGEATRAELAERAAKEALEGAKGGKEDDDSEEEEEQLSPQEMRARRMARFGGP
ncbi:Ataxin 3/Josephin [Ceraceosorus bombacis]|uniref:ubiquitinyl hydrolase 1 n=1 Tax=Ceraceosorus bombacis TaxID=401625 RepID=A0A0P1BKJ0_9BASI|nr:Ataxin 3/Josephin [Ceraceosorus bombacis]